MSSARDHEIQNVRFESFDVRLRSPFGIATGKQVVAENVLVSVETRAGVIGMGEAAPFPAANGETRASTLAALERLVGVIRDRSVGSWRAIANEMHALEAGAGAARCALETAVLDAFTRAHAMALPQFFGGSDQSLVTDLTITTGTPQQAEADARALASNGYRAAKLKVGGGRLADDLERIDAVAAGAPGIDLILDGNTRIATVDDAVEMCARAERSGVHLVLFEQPSEIAALDEMAEIHRRTGVRIAADEGVRNAHDVVRHAERGSAQVVNLKITKTGVAETLAIAQTARAHGMALMIGGMVETSLAMSMSACIAAGLGGFEFVDLDTPVFMLDEPFAGGVTRDGARLSVSEIRLGHGVHHVRSARKPSDER